MKRILLAILVSVCVIGISNAQQDPLYAQYINNPMVLNPAYAGLNNNFNVSLSYRAQWAGLEGSPTTVNLNGHTSLIDNKVGVGVMLVQDQLGSVSNTEFQATFSYKLQLDDRVFSFGMQAGFLNMKNDYSDLTLDDANDPAFTENQSFTKPNLGAGFILKSERYFVGVSIPRLLGANITTTAGEDFQLYNQHFYMLGSYMIYLDERFRLKPSVLLKAVKGSPLSTDLNFNLNLDQNYTAGIFTRNFNTYGILVQALLGEKFKVGYNFEVPTKNSVGAQFTTHELMLGLKMSLLPFHDRSFSNF
jgi:type IX secretion system PorP/SprF family membrane protein